MCRVIKTHYDSYSSLIGLTLAAIIVIPFSLVRLPFKSTGTSDTGPSDASLDPALLG